MAAGLSPSPHRRHELDRGTNPRIDTPRPATVGFDSKRPRATKTSGADLAKKILAYARALIGQKDGDGECTTLVENALTKGKARRAEDYGKVGPDTDYKWGTRVPLARVHPGDIVQFRDYSFHMTVVTQTRTGNRIETLTQTNEQSRPHHTAIVEKVHGDGSLTVLEQNIEAGPVIESKLFFKDRASTAPGETTTIKVHGKFWFYRPQSR